MDSCDQQIQVGGSSTPTPGNPLQQSTMISPSSDTTCRGGAADMDRWRDVPFQCLLALAQTPSAFNYGVPQQQHYGLGLPPPPPPPPPPTIAESSSTKTGLTFAPLTPHKNNKSSRDQSLECEPDLLCLETLQQADDFPLQPDGRPPDEHCSSSAVGLTWENHSREKVDFKVIDLNKTPPRRKPKRKKHIPKVRVDGKPNKGKSPSHKTQKQPKRKNDKRKDSNPHARAHAGNPNTHESATSNANHTGTSKDEKQGAATEEASTTPVLDAAIAFKEDTPRNILKYSRRGVHKTASTMEPAPELPAASRAVFSGNSRHDATEGSTTPPAEATGESADPRCPQPTKRPCRRMLDFNLDGPKPQSREATGLPPKPTTHNGIEVKVQNTLTGHPYDFNTSVNEMVKRYSSKPGNIAPGTPLRENGNCSQWNVNSSESNDADIEKAGTRSTLLMPPISIASSGISSTTLADVGEASESAHKHSCPIESATGFSSGSSSYQSLPWALMPVCRKKRTGKGQSSTIFGMPVSLAAEKAIISCTPTANINYLTYAHSQEKALPGRVPEAGSSLQNKLHNFSPLNEIEMSTKRRSRAHVRVRDLASLANIPLLTGQTPPTSDNRHVRNSNRPDMNMEALLAGGKATSKRKKISKGNLKAKYASSRVNDKRRREIMVPLDQNQFPAQSSGSLEMLFNQMLYVDALAEQLKHLSINRESPIFANTQMNQLIPYRAGKQKQNAMMKNNAMVVYTGNDRMVIPFPPVKKKRPRAKVDLDEETERVFNLLLKDINSEGIDGTTEAKKKYWENERRIFRGRTDSFIARMHLVQGDRRFTKWKGSVVDSVVGVFLTQNVSDHLSSSAFMSMAAHFPVKKHQKAYWEEGMPCVVTNPIISMPDEETTILDEMSNQSVFYRSSITLHEPLHEEVEVVHTIDTTRSTSSNTNEFVVGQQNYNESVISSQNSTVSSQNSNSPVSQTVDRKESSSETDSQELDTSGGALVNTLNGGSSFVELLQMAQSGSSMPHEVPSLLHQRLNETEKIPLVDIQTRKEFVEDLRIIGEPLKQLAGNELQQKEQLVNCQVEISDIAESSSKFKKETTSEKRTTSKLINQPYKGAKDIDAARRKAKSRRVGDEIKDADWEALRRGAIKSAGKKERAENAMDSVDWEAVRCADVGEIAETIKARGMNNMLAARIKEFLNKLVTYHGSVDLEWLRDVAPDRAKEYLLSFNGLGLKSVECVRLLTLHHLAFPVDTNVGRIAVRLGWVPLEPLPESLQLHLLEMYPILDTIQKYLWPRLCKLDQKTLYELHYQLITFGKVFCTKSKPNCNACPMRGECRHFASAFASARLSLPGPEEKRIVNVTQDRPTFPRPVMQDAQRFLPPPTICEQPNQPMLTLSLPPSRSCAPEQENHQQSALRTSMPEQENHRSATDSTKVDCVPIIEEPLSPEPECTQVSIPDMEDAFFEDPDEIPAIDEIPTIDLNVNVLAQNIKTYIEQTLDLRESDISLDLVAMATEATSIPPPKLKNISRLRTEHQVYELPDCHPLLQELDKREYDDPSPYLLAIWTPGETADSIEPPKRMCTSQSEGRLCEEGTCASCNNYLEARRQIVRGTILIPCRTAMRGSFPLNGTYFQVNEVFADQESSFRPIEVPRSWLWNLPRRTVYFGTSVPTIFRGLTTEEIQQCFWRGFVCVRGFDRVTRDPRPLMARLHYPASKLRPKGKNEADS